MLFSKSLFRIFLLCMTLKNMLVRSLYVFGDASHRLAIIRRPWKRFSVPVSKNRGRHAIDSSRCFSSSKSNTDDEHRVITFLTDVEGDADYLNRYVNMSRVLQFQDVQPRWQKSETEPSFFPYNKCIDFQDDRGMLVFGGDVWDKGGADLYVIRQLLDLKDRYPHRVFFVMGNRDINKMRIAQELGDKGSPECPHHPGVYWFQGTGRVGDPAGDSPVPKNPAERLRWMLGQTMGSPNAFELRRLELSREKAITTNQQLGESEGDNKLEAISDQDVVESYRESCHPNGEIGKYLQNAQLALRLGEALFLHGSLPLVPTVLDNAIATQSSLDKHSNFLWEDPSFAMPWRPDAAEQVDVGGEKEGSCAVDDWLESLNSFASDSVAGWKRQKESPANSSDMIWSQKGGYRPPTNPLVFGNLMQYGMGWTPDRQRNPTVVYASWCTDGMPERFYPDTTDPQKQMFVQLTRDFLSYSGLRIVLSGHQPCGDIPLPIRVNLGNTSSSIHDGKNEDNRWILCCDTSYSGDTLWYNQEGNDKEEVIRENLGRGKCASFRGEVAVSETLIELCVTSGKVISTRYHGVLSDGSSYETNDLFCKDEIDEVGMLARMSTLPSDRSDSPASNDKWWTKATFVNGKKLVTSAKGYDVWNSVLSQNKSV